MEDFQIDICNDGCRIWHWSGHYLSERKRKFVYSEELNYIQRLYIAYKLKKFCNKELPKLFPSLTFDIQDSRVLSVKDLS